jgi:PhzF family phenazine biosynthesis protein
MPQSDPALQPDSTLKLDFGLLDVFAARPLAGNSLSVFPLQQELPTSVLQQLTVELRQFESIFLWPTEQPHTFRTRIFTMEEELGFAGHPILGAAVYLHRRHFAAESSVELILQTPEKTVPVSSRYDGARWTAEMDQGEASIQAPLAEAEWAELLAAFNLSSADLADGLPPQVISTGLPYLILPLKQGLERAAVTVRDLEARQARIGAKFTYLLDVHRLEGRTWDNDGRVEDIATGSAAGPAAIYLVKHGICQKNRAIVLQQGRFVGRPSELIATVYGDERLGVRVAGQVVPVGGGTLELPASTLQGDTK